MALRTPLLALFDVLENEESGLNAVRHGLEEQQRRLNELAKDNTSPLALKWIALQARFEYNLPVRLMEWLKQTIQSANRSLDRAVLASRIALRKCSLKVTGSASVCIGAAIRLLQTCLLLHPRSTVLFARPAAWTTVLRLLERSATASSTADRLTLAVLELILFALVDRPRNIRQFEQSQCLAKVVQSFKDKTASHAVRLKSLEILYYYMLPEVPASPMTSYAGSEGWSRADYPQSPEQETPATGQPFFPTSSEMSRLRLEVLETPRKPTFQGGSDETPRASSGLRHSRSPSSFALSSIGESADRPATFEQERDRDRDRDEERMHRARARLSLSDIPSTPRSSRTEAAVTPTSSSRRESIGLTRSDSQRALASITNAASALVSRMSASASNNKRLSVPAHSHALSRSLSPSSPRSDAENREPFQAGLVRSRSTLLSPSAQGHRRSRSTFAMGDIDEARSTTPTPTPTPTIASSPSGLLMSKSLAASPSLFEIANHRTKFELREPNADGTRDPSSKKDLLKCFLSNAQLDRLEHSFQQLMRDR